MNAKYILSLCFVMNYLVILSVANPEKELVQAVYDKLLKVLDAPPGSTLFVGEINELWKDEGKTMNANFTPQEIEKMKEVGIDVEKFEEVTRKIALKEGRDYVTYMKDLHF